MKDLVVLLLRISLGIAFLSAVADRFGYWGAPGAAGVAWGNMDNFLQYTSLLTFGATGILLQILGWTATILEALFGILLIVGLKIKQVAFLSGVLLLCFGIGMACNISPKTPFDYSVFSACFGAFLLMFQPVGKWGLDSFLKR